MITLQAIFATGALGAALLCAAARQGADKEPFSEAAGKAKMRVELALEGDRFVVGESVDFQVRYINDGATLIEAPEPVWEVNWQPRFTLTGPLCPDGYEFSPRSAVLEDTRLEPDGIEPALTKIAPGATFEQAIPLDRWVSLEEPGDYTLTAGLYWRDLQATSQPVAFRMESPSMQSVSIGCIIGSDMRLIDGAWLQKKGDHCQLFQLTYTEDRPDLGEMSRPESRKMLETGPDATDVLTPYRYMARKPSFHFWYAWREGASLLARSFLLEKPLKVDLGAVPAFVIRPALMTSKGELNVFVVAAGGRELQMVSFPPPTKDGKPNAPTVRWKLPFPSPVQCATCALDGRSDSENRRIVLAAQKDDGVTLYHVMLTPGAASAAETVQLKNAILMPDTQIGLRIDPQGISHVGLLYETNRETRAFSVADVLFGPEGKRQGAPVFQKLGVLPAAPKANTTAFQLMGVEPGRRDWAVLLEGNRVASSLDPSRVTALRAPAALPLTLLVRTQSSYLLTLDPKSGPAFAHLP